MDPFLLFFLLIVLIGIVTVSIYYFKEKSQEYHTIMRGFCPKCRQKNIVLTDKRGGGCGGTSTVSYECDLCGYRNTFHIDTHGCGKSGCSF